MKHWSRNDKFAFVGVILAVIGLASALFGQEIRRGLGLDQPAAVNQAALGEPAPAQEPTPPKPPGSNAPLHREAAARQEPPPSAGAAVPKMPIPEMTIKVTGDGNTITLTASPVVSADHDYTVSGDSAPSDFTLGPDQTAHIEIKGDGNTIRVAAKLKDRVTVVNNGDGNKVLN